MKIIFKMFNVYNIYSSSIHRLKELKLAQKILLWDYLERKKVKTFFTRKQKSEIQF